MTETICSNDATMNENQSSRNPAETNTSTREGMGWLLPLLLLVLTLGLVLYFINSFHNYKQAIAWQFINPDDTAASKPITVKSDSAIKQEVQLQLPDTTIAVIKGGIEYRLALYISSNNPQDSINNNRWFEFEEPTFESNTAIPTESLTQQIQNLATILKKYPHVQIRIGCYANDTQNSAANLELSRSRATVVSVALKKFGVNERQIVTTEGFGARDTRADASEIRIKRTSAMINVVAK